MLTLRETLRDAIADIEIALRDKTELSGESLKAINNAKKNLDDAVARFSIEQEMPERGDGW